MPARIIIDGYNLIRQSPTLRSKEKEDFTSGRQWLIEKLSLYRIHKPYPITVVFDGWQEGSPFEQRTKEKGIDVIYSKRGEKADEVIKRLVTYSPDELVVVTSDREITRFCDGKKCQVIAAPLFEEKLTSYSSAPWKNERENDTPHLSSSTRKRGPAKKLPKAIRKKLRWLQKL